MHVTGQLSSVRARGHVRVWDYCDVIRARGHSAGGAGAPTVPEAERPGRAGRCCSMFPGVRHADAGQ